MKKSFYILLFSLLCGGTFSACTTDETIVKPVQLNNEFSDPPPSEEEESEIELN